jgi:3-ketosteroid 9alpha-monooxygenase subunit B
MGDSDTDKGAPTGDPRHHYHDLRVRRLVRETADASSIVFEVPSQLADTFAYESGQFLTLQVPWEGKVLYRCYSLCSSPVTDTEHKVTIKRVAGGRISNWINESLREGDLVKVLPPAGRFVLGAGDADLVLFAGGSGITPVLSILKTALATTARRVRLVYANRDEASIIFRSELDALAAAHTGRLDVIHRLDVRDGFVDASVVRRALEGRERAECYICGPGPFMDIVEATLREAGVADASIHIERFTADEPDAGAEGVAGPLHRAAVHLDGERKDLEVREGETILHAARRCGLEPPFSCESGFCGCCMAKLKAGRVRMLNNDFLSPAEIEEGWVLTCQSIPETPEVEVEYQD